MKVFLKQLSQYLYRYRKKFVAPGYFGKVNACILYSYGEHCKYKNLSYTTKSFTTNHFVLHDFKQCILKGHIRLIKIHIPLFLQFFSK